MIIRVTYLPTGESFEVSARTNARLRKLIDAECADRNWDIYDTDYVEVK